MQVEYSLAGDFMTCKLLLIEYVGSLDNVSFIENEGFGPYAPTMTSCTFTMRKENLF